MIQNLASCIDPDRSSRALKSRPTSMEYRSAAELGILHQKTKLPAFVQNANSHRQRTYANLRQHAVCKIAQCGWHVPEYSKGVVYLASLALCVFLTLAPALPARAVTVTASAT